MSRAIQILGPLLLALASATRAADEEALAKFEQALDALRLQYRIPGLAAAMVKNQQIVWERGFGYADLEQRIPTAPDTPFQVASLTKTLPSTLLMRCVEQGALSLDEPIAKHTLAIPEPGVTVRHVLTHTSASVPPGDAFLYDGNRFMATHLRGGVVRRGGVSRTSGQEYPASPPDVGLGSGPGPQNITPAVARSLNPDVFDRTTLDRYQRALDWLAEPYTYDSRGELVRSSLFAYKLISASAGLVSTVRDLALFDVAIDRHLLLNPETQELAWQPAVTSRGQTLPYALGWYSQRVPGRRFVWHYGNFPGAYSSLYLNVPERKLSLLLLANSDRLSSLFPIGLGDVSWSPFAALFLQLVEEPGALAAESPAIAARGVVNAASFTGPISPGSWVTIIGQNFVQMDPADRIWRPEEVAGGILPTSLDGVSARTDGKPASMYFVSPGQLNVQAPHDLPPGPVGVEVLGPTGASRSAAVVKEVAPGLFTYGEWSRRVYAAAVSSEGTPLAPAELIPGARPAQPGEVILLFGTGFGATNPVRPSGRLIDPAPLANPFAVSIGDVAAEIGFGGLVSPGLYQFNVRVPQLPDGDHTVLIEVAHERTQPGVVIQVTTNPK